MKCCNSCGTEISTRDGENKCKACEDNVNAKRKADAKAARRERAEALRSLGLVRVRGAMGGTYWE